MTNKYRHLFQPFEIGNVTLKNRIVKSAQWFIYVEPDGSVGERLKAWYRSLAQGGAGLIVVEESTPDFPLSASNVPHLRLDDDKYISGMHELTDLIHEYDCAAFVQITHAGPAHNPTASGLQPVAPSSIDPPAKPHFSIAREIRIDEIKKLVEEFAQAALRAKKAGFDGVEMHMAHYALLNAFLSRVQNKRQDEYGCQNLENRARFSVEILRRVRELVGPDFVVGVRMCAKEWGHELGTTNEEAIQFAKMFQDEGVNYLQLSAYGYGSFSGASLPDMVVYPEVLPETQEFTRRIKNGALIPEAAAVRREISIPVSGVGRLDYRSGNRAISQGEVDLVCFGRRLMADPEFPNKVASGKEKDIRPCLGCCNCYHMYLLNQPVQCRMNPFAGNELEMVVEPTEVKRKVMVIGAGPAGMEAARVAALRGHEVHLYDQSRKLGGLLNLAALIKGSDTDSLTEVISYYRRQLRNLNVRIHLGVHVDPAGVIEQNPDAVIVSPGGKASPHEISVADDARMITTDQLKYRVSRFLQIVGPGLLGLLTKWYLPIGKRVIIIGGGLAGLETAEFLIKRGRKVIVVDSEKEIGHGMLIPWMQKLMPWMEKKGTNIYSGVKYKSLTAKGLSFTDSKRKKQNLLCDTTILISKYGPNHDLFNELKGKLDHVYLIGDAKSDEPGYIIGAIHDGAQIGLQV